MDYIDDELRDIQRRMRFAATRLTSPFCCGGYIHASDPIRLAYKGGSSWLEIGPTAGNIAAGSLEDLISACSQASFGKGGETVFDPAYRKSLKLDPSHFITSFQLSSYNVVLDEIKSLLAPEARSIRAELYKLNVYREGDFFKPHVDTPRAGSFASLVVCLPIPFSGGELVVEHRKRVQEFDWSTTDQQSTSCRRSTDDNYPISWAAFYSDLIHQVKPIKSGVRLTLTFNLYQEEYATAPAAPFSTLDFSKADFYITLCDVVNNYTSRDTITLGFACAYLYPFVLQQNVPRRQMVGMLKGEDAVLYASAIAAGLRPMLHRVWKADSDDCADVNYGLDRSFDGVFVGNRDVSNLYVLEELGFDKGDDIIWCNDNFDWQVGGSCQAYGNEAYTQELYCSVAILITIKGN